MSGGRDCHSVESESKSTQQHEGCFSKGQKEVAENSQSLALRSLQVCVFVREKERESSVVLSAQAEEGERWRKIGGEKDWAHSNQSSIYLSG